MTQAHAAGDPEPGSRRLGPGQRGTHGALWGLQLQELGRHPALRAGDARVQAEAAATGWELLAEAEVGEDHPALALAIGPQDEDVGGLQVPVHCEGGGQLRAGRAGQAGAGRGEGGGRYLCAGNAGAPGRM